MKVADLQIWLNTKIKENNLNIKPLVVDSVGGPITRNAVYEVFKCKNAKPVTEAELLDFAKQLGDTNTKRIKAIGKVETSGSAWTSDGTPKILYERHYFYKYVFCNSNFQILQIKYLFLISLSFYHCLNQLLCKFHFLKFLNIV